MTPPQFLLSHYIKNLKNTDNINKYLYQNYNIMTKDYPGMTIYYNKYDNKHKTQLESASRSVIMDENHNVLCYTCNTPLYNTDAIQYLLRNKDKDKTTYVCYEGSLISLFNHNNEWYISSRKNIIKVNSEENDETGGQFKMFKEVLNQENKTLNDLCVQLNSENTYHFVLIHHQNKNIVDYESIFGKEYKKLCFIFARNKTSQEEIKTTDINTEFLSDNIIMPMFINDELTKTFISKLSDDNVMQQPDIEGLIIKVNNQVLKLQSSSYQFHKSIGSDKNMFRGFITLYQNNGLKNFLTKDNNSKSVFKKIVNPLNTKESFDTMGMIDALFKVITSELHKLFYLLWDDNGNHNNKELYKLLPREYKDILFHLRGIFFQARNNKTSSNTEEILKLKDVYQFIKSIDIVLFENFIRCRKLMLNWMRINKNDENVNKFVSTLYKCEKVYYKLAAIYTTKLFPEIMPDDLPTFGTA
jgi:hypothetical protein